MVPSRNGAIWNCARECALRRLYKNCREDFDSPACNDCPYYIKRYGDFSPADANLYIMEAELFAADNKQARSLVWTPVIVVLVVIAAVIVINILDDRQTEKHFQEYMLERRSQTERTAPSGVFRDIDDTLYKVARDLKAGKDVNNDGRVNCIDAAVLFYRYFPDKDIVCIESNIHPDGRMAHLFNCVQIDGVWRAIEPQAYHKDHTTYWMANVWGRDYDKRYNTDETKRYAKYAK